MAVSGEDVRHIADLARLGLEPGRVDLLVRELNGILAHMEELQAAELARDGEGVAAATEPSLPLRADEGPQLPLAATRETFAPEMRDGFFLVPRLATHEGDAESSP